MRIAHITLATSISKKCQIASGDKEPVGLHFAACKSHFSKSRLFLSRVCFSHSRISFNSPR